ncbi:hypothetical protein COMNV_00251 [Commensalibacter sp. Nvir]|nr:hypothetical protein COMNV_00251 [Commensalibacter sp. Nvir]
MRKYEPDFCKIFIVKKQPILIFGASLKNNGSPPAALLNRVEAAYRYGVKCAFPLYVVSGGNAQCGRTEAMVMEKLLLEKNVKASQILREDQAKNTLDSVLYCSEILEKQHFYKENTTLVLVTSAYHILRCSCLMRLKGWTVRPVRARGQASRNFRKRWYWRLREIPALLWDSLRLTLNCGKKILKSNKKN